jgi:hypothetical protein
MQQSESRLEQFFGIAFFVLAIAADFLFGINAFVRVAGCAMIVCGFYWIFTQKIPVGWKGRPPSFYITGWFAIVLGIAQIGLGVVLVYFAPVVACALGWSDSSTC